MLNRDRVLLAALLTVACRRAPDGAAAPDPRGVGDYWCIVGSAGHSLQGRCSASEMSCASHLRAAVPADAALRCEPTRALVYMLRWSTQYGPSEAWYVDAAACERARAGFSQPPEPCSAAPWESTGRRAH